MKRLLLLLALLFPAQSGRVYSAVEAKITHRSVRPSYVNSGDTFIVSVRLKNVGSSAADRGGVAVSFPDITSSNDEAFPAPPRYSTADLYIAPHWPDSPSDTTLSFALEEIIFSAAGALIDRGGYTVEARYLLVETVKENWAAGEEREFCLTVKPSAKPGSGAIMVNVRGWLESGTTVSRDPPILPDYGEDGFRRKTFSVTSLGSDRQQSYPIYFYKVPIDPYAFSWSDLYFFTPLFLFVFMFSLGVLLVYLMIRPHAR